MKNRLFVSFICLVLMIFAVQCFAAGTSTLWNRDTYKDEGAPGSAWVHYYGSTATVIANTDSIGTHYTKAMWIGDYNQLNCYYSMVMSNSARGTEDCNVTIQYSADGDTSWYAGSVSSGKIKDQLTTMQVQDTVNVIVGVNDDNYPTGLWCRLKFENQAGNPYLTTLTWHLFFRKDPTFQLRNAKVHAY